MKGSSSYETSHVQSEVDGNSIHLCIGLEAEIPKEKVNFNTLI